MIQLISKGDLENGGHEQIWSFILFHVEPSMYFNTIRNSSQYEVDKEARNERAEVILKGLGKYISLEECNGLSKDQLETEAIETLKKMYDSMSLQRYNIKRHCKLILKYEVLINRLGRPGNQYVYYKMLINTATEQLRYEKENETI